VVETPPIPAVPRARRILVIEDNVDAAQLLAEVLQMGGHSVRIAHDGLDGVALALAMVPEVVFCDLGLPGLDGFGVARALRADERLCSTVLIAISGYSRRQDRARSAAAGFDFHLAKPATVSDLESLLASLP
jgi:CheY-like chemotaxis protein